MSQTAAVIPVSSDQSPRTDRDLQRAALTDLISLAADCATAESDIEREYRTSLEKAGQSFNDRTFELDEHHKRSTAETNDKHQARLAELTRQYQAERSKIIGADRALRQKIESDKLAVDEALKKKLDQSTWLADSVLEVCSNQIAAAFKAKTVQVEAALEALNSSEVQAAELVQRYGMALPTDSPQVEDDPAIVTDSNAAFARHKEAAEKHLAHLEQMPAANLFVGARPYLIPVLVCVVAGGAVQGYFQTTEPHWEALGIAVGSAFAVTMIVGIVLRLMANSQIRAVHTPLRIELILAHRSADQQLVDAGTKRDADRAASLLSRNSEVQAAKELIGPHAVKAFREREIGITNAQTDLVRQTTRIDKIRQTANAETDERLRRQLHDLEHKLSRDHKANEAAREDRLKKIEQRYQDRRQELQQRWTAGLQQIQAPIDQNENGSPTASPAWSDAAWKTWTPPKTFAARVRFGEMQVDLKQIAENVPQRLTLPPTFSLPAMLAFPAQASLLIHTEHAGRAEALNVLQMMMTRLLTSLPPGRVRLSIIDPVGLGQNFAGFMHLADYDDALVASRIWTSQEQIEHRLANLTEHMETVIQKYLRNEFETIDDYNAQAGELAEPYRFLVIADLPVGFTSDSFRRLNSIATSGARCGVYTLVVRDTRAPLPAGVHLDEIKAHSVNLIRQNDRFVWDDPIFRALPLDLDAPPPEDALTEILHKVGARAKESKRIEVPFELIAPSKDKIWSGSTTSELDVPIGRLGATRLQSLKLGRGVAQHVLIAGKTGSGKSTLLHAMITNSAMWYSPDEIELYLIDFKKGVEFKTYATHQLPHARAIAVESDREFGLSVLQRLDAELARRGELFRKAAVQDLGAYRKTPNAQIIPRTLLIIDEFQEFFTEDDKLAQESALLIDRLVRQGRAFGVHVLLGSQTIGGAGGLPRSTLGQMAVRIALQTSEADSQLILGDNNSAARLLSRPGEAIYNDAGGLVEGNSPFQIAWLPDEKRDIYLTDLASRAQPYFERFGQPVVFEGNAPADIRRNAKLMAAIDSPRWQSTPPVAWLGDPVAIKDPTAITFRRQAGANVLIVGQQEEQALALMAAITIGIASQQRPGQAIFQVLDGTAADSVLAGNFDKIKSALPQEMKLIEWRATADAIDELAKEVARRQESDQPGAPSIYVLVYGLQRYRMLRKQEDDYSFSASSDEPKKPNTGKQFAEILREGPPLGVHVITWADTLVAVDRTLDRGSMREFDNRILFQMSAADSSNLIDSPAGNKLGFFRALIFSEEQGIMERFRPYSLPPADFLAQVKSALAKRPPA